MTSRSMEEKELEKKRKRTEANGKRKNQDFLLEKMRDKRNK